MATDYKTKIDEVHIKAFEVFKEKVNALEDKLSTSMDIVNRYKFEAGLGLGLFTESTIMLNSSGSDYKKINAYLDESIKELDKKISDYISTIR